MYFSQVTDWFNKHSTAKTGLLGYALGALVCTVVYGVRRGVRGLREYHIEKHKNPPNQVQAETAMDRVLYETLKGGAQGLIPSFIWPAHLVAYGIVKWKEPEIVEQVQKELQNAKK